MYKTKFATALAGASIAAIVLAGCTDATEPDTTEPPVIETPAPVEPAPEATETDDAEATDERQNQYDAAIASFPYDLPPGHEWPEIVPEDFAAGGTTHSGELAATFVWACSVINTAWDTAKSGDTQAADQIIALLNQDERDWDIHGPTNGWNDSTGRMGDDGLCRQWHRIIQP